MTRRGGAERFWANVDKRLGQGPGGQCWSWTKFCSQNGYGQLWWEGAPTGAHRVAWILEYGPPPQENPWVLNRCDNPPCVRPDHLFVGSSLDNIRDGNEKGRMAKGISAGGRFTEDDVREIRRATSVHSQRKIAAAYGVTQAAIHCIVTRRCYAY